MTKIISLLCGVSLLSGCTIRAVAILETEDAVYGTTEIKKAQKYDAHQNHLGFFESFMGAINSDSIDAVGRNANGQRSTITETTIPPAAKITPVPAGTSVLVQPE